MPEWADRDWLRHLELVPWDDFIRTRPAARDLSPMTFYRIDLRSPTDDSG